MRGSLKRKIKRKSFNKRNYSKKIKYFKKKNYSKKRKSFLKKISGGAYSGEDVDDSDPDYETKMDKKFPKFPDLLAENELKQVRAPIYKNNVRDVLGNYAVETGDTDLARLNLAGKDLIGNSELINKIYSNIEKLPTSFLRDKSIAMYNRLPDLRVYNQTTQEVFDFFYTNFKLFADDKTLPFSFMASNGIESYAFRFFIDKFRHNQIEQFINYIMSFPTDFIEETEPGKIITSRNVGGMDHIWNEQDTRKTWQAIYIALKANLDR